MSLGSVNTNLAGYRLSPVSGINTTVKLPVRGKRDVSSETEEDSGAKPRKHEEGDRRVIDVEA